MLWHESPYYEHIYSQFKPWVHFVPIKRDFSDLIEQVQWAIQNDAEAQRIATAGLNLAREILTAGKKYEVAGGWAVTERWKTLTASFVRHRECVLLHRKAVC